MSSTKVLVIVWCSTCAKKDQSLVNKNRAYVTRQIGWFANDCCDNRCTLEVCIWMISELVLSTWGQPQNKGILQRLWLWGNMDEVSMILCLFLNSRIWTNSNQIHVDSWYVASTSYWSNREYWDTTQESACALSTESEYQVPKCTPKRSATNRNSMSVHTANIWESIQQRNQWSVLIRNYSYLRSLIQVFLHDTSYEYMICNTIKGQMVPISRDS